MSTYSEKLKDPRWQKKLLEIMQRDDFTCQDCNNKEETLHVHHKTYEFGKDPWEYPDTNFITLCWECHETEEISKVEFNSAVQNLLLTGFSYKNLWMLISQLDYPSKFAIDERIRYISFCASNEYLLNEAKDMIEKGLDDFFEELKNNQ
jgi:hypothetical protein